MLKILKLINRLLGVVPHKTLIGILLKALAAAFPAMAPLEALHWLEQISDVLFYAGVFNWRLSDYVKDLEFKAQLRSASLGSFNASR